MTSVVRSAAKSDYSRIFRSFWTAFVHLFIYFFENFTSIPSGIPSGTQALYVVSLVFACICIFFLPLLEIHMHSRLQNNLCALAAARRMITSLFTGSRLLFAFLARDHAFILLAGNYANHSTCIFLKHIR